VLASLEVKQTLIIHRAEGDVGWHGERGSSPPPLSHGLLQASWHSYIYTYWYIRSVSSYKRRWKHLNPDP
jgi:hypothetical protein